MSQRVRVSSFRRGWWMAWCPCCGAMNPWAVESWTLAMQLAHDHVRRAHR